MTLYKVTAVNLNNQIEAQICILSSCEDEAAEFLHHATLGQHCGIKVIEIED